MCELFGVNGREAVKCNGMLLEFFGHGSSNPHGWGLAAFYGNAVSLEKEPISSVESEYLKNRLTDDIVKDRLIAHVRKASRGNVTYQNTHPFIQRDSENRAWTLAHKGTVFESNELEPYRERQKGQTDSERILCYLVDRMNAAQKGRREALTEKERFLAVEEVVHAIAPKNQVILLIYDGELFYIHTNYKDRLYRYQKGKSLFVASKPFRHGCWEHVPMNTLLAYRDGELAYVGREHGHEYIEKEGQLDFA